LSVFYCNLYVHCREKRRKKGGKGGRGEEEGREEGMEQGRRGRQLTKPYTSH
jgi:hypothetical protein